MCNLKPERFLLFVFILFLPFVTLQATELHDLLDSAGFEQNRLNQVDFATLTSMIEYAEEGELTIFETLYEAGIYLKQRNLRVSINGDDLRILTQKYDLGGERVNTLLPFEKIIFIELGSSFGKTKPEMEVSLAEKHSDYLEIGDFFLQKHFGFNTLNNNWFDEAFGVRVKYLFFTLDLNGLELYDKSKIAIFASGIPKPKRWRIKPVRILD